MLEHIEHHGYYLQENGSNVGEWCSDAAIKAMGLTREQAFDIPELAGMAMGLDLRRAECQQFVRDWLGMAHTFPGYHTNSVALDAAGQPYAGHRNVGFVSDNPQVKGHRHDQSAASVLSHRLDWKLTPRPILVDYWREYPDPRTVVLARGM
jgi:hypothetical protein